MNRDDLCALDSAAAAEARLRFADMDAHSLALQAHRHPDLPLRALAEQAHLRQRYQAKLLDWSQRMLLEARACEQTANLAVARWKAGQFLAAGMRVCDCCAGLGCDILAAAEAGCTATAIESDPLLAALLERNARALGLSLQVLQTDGSHPPASFDCLLCDPDRRPQGKRSLDPQDWCPRPLEILSQATGYPLLLLKIAPGSNPQPLLEAAPGWRQLIAISWRGELKEIILAVRGQAAPAIAAPWAVGLDGAGRECFRCLDDGLADYAPNSPHAEAEWMLEPDPGVIRLGLVAAWARRYGLNLVHPQVALAYGARPDSGFPGRGGRILWQGRWQLKSLRKQLRAQGLSALRVSRRHFPWKPQEILDKLGLPEGGQHHLFCFRDREQQLRCTLTSQLEFF